MFCLLCNSEEKLYDGLCKECFLKEFELVEVPEYATFTVCSHCGATLKHDKWVQTGYYDDEIINDAIQKDIEIISGIEDKIAELSKQLDNIDAANTGSETSGVTTFTNLTGKDFDGNDVDASLFSNNAVTVLNFWFTGCKPCVEELAKLNELNE